MFISVIIPHFNQEDYLRICLDRLHAQTGCTVGVEIIVVDNGSTRMPDEVCAAFPNVYLLKEERPGPGHARNAGATTAIGDVLAFIDADCYADQGWFSAIEKRFRTPSTQIVGGDVRVGYSDPINPTFVEPYEAIYSFRNEKYIEEGFSGTGNLAVRSEVLRHVGPFGGIDIAEDRDWGLRANALQYKIDYDPLMVVYHPARKSFGELMRKWDRHIAHDFSNHEKTILGKVKWMARALAVACSPLIEIRTILQSRRVSGWRERCLAFACLCSIRLYRCKRMITTVFLERGQANRSWRQ